MTWRQLLTDNKQLIQFFISVILLISALVLLTNFLNFVEQRNGVGLNDPLLSMFEPVDLTWLTFGLIYLSLAAAVFMLRNNPVKLMFTVQLYVLMVVIRIAAMYLLPLEPPAQIIVLADPVVELFGTGESLTKDLFFSGHTASLFIFYLAADDKRYKSIFLCATILVAVSVILQHVHYTIDVLAAVLFTYAAYNLLKKIRTKLKLNY